MFDELEELAEVVMMVMMMMMMINLEVNQGNVEKKRRGPQGLKVKKLCLARRT